MSSEYFDGYWRGILQRAHPRGWPAGYVQEALNLAFVGGVPVSRPGLRPYCGAACSDNIKGLTWHVTAAGVRELIAATGTTFQRIPPYGDPITIPQTVPSSGYTRSQPTRCHFLNISGGAPLTLIYDGVNPCVKYDGNQITKMGLSAGPAPAAPTQASGSITPGTRKYRMTLSTPYHEGEGGPATSVTIAAGANMKCTFTSPANGVDYDDPQVTKWNLYRTVADGEDYFLVGSADIGVAITDDTPDDTLDAGAALEEFLNDEPGAGAWDGVFTAMTEHRGQILAVDTHDENMVRYSNVSEDYQVPEGWPQEWAKPVAHGDGDRIRALASFHEFALAFKENATYALEGIWPDIDISPVFAAGGGERQGIGVIAPGAVLHIENTIIFAARDGVYRIARSGSEQAPLTAIRLSGAIDDLYNAANFSYGSSTAFDRRRRVFIFFGRG